ncbi:YveK family protein [Tumebacillus flagellatus]|uniref:Polysaccharide chain length determinant N-terminal domain-containing protein n=1 Tax=Tumebacillus flagellatus TaxID=1157490 RepID=A0A074LFK5_9BACL|nr:Wzz/FepE/Etk N-terminal domain-containing protein [Tumebacillus flagellatus]KEO81026.1 hypothetical protein EL26_23080 [Tumebacillus flagellatus]
MEIDITQLWAVLRRRWLFIWGLAAVAVLCAGLVSYYVLEPKYEATSTLIVKKPPAVAGIEYNDLMASGQLLNTFEQIIKSRRVVKGVIDDLGLTTTPEELLKQIDVKVENNSLVASITVTDRQADQAMKIANRFADRAQRESNTIMGTNYLFVLDYAELQNSPQPVSPRPFFLMGMAFVAALLAGVGLAVLFEKFDKTMKTEAQLVEDLEVPVLGTIPMVKKARKKQNDPDSTLGGVAHEN